MKLQEYKNRIETLRQKSEEILKDKNVDFNEIEAFISFHDETRNDFLEETIGSKQLNKKFKNLPIMGEKLSHVKNTFINRLLGKIFTAYNPVKKAKKLIRQNKSIYSKIDKMLVKEVKTA